MVGTNYYLHEDAPCPTCGRGGEPLHIGKSSFGWCFSLHVIPEEGLNDLDDWIARWAREGVQIQDEYGQVVPKTEMASKIMERRGSGNPLAPSWLVQNGAELGPHNLARHPVSGTCIGHGAGTWDLIVGDFF